MKMINFIKIKKKKTDSTVTSTGINFNELSIRVVRVLFRRRILRHFSSFHTRRTPKKKKKKLKLFCMIMNVRSRNKMKRETRRINTAARGGCVRGLCTFMFRQSEAFWWLPKSAKPTLDWLISFFEKKKNTKQICVSVQKVQICVHVGTWEWSSYYYFYFLPYIFKF